jgi:hypothetical protein
VVCTSSHHSGEKSSTLRYAAGMKSGAFGFSDDDDAVAMVEALVLVGVENSGWLSLGGGGVYTHHCYARKEGWWCGGAESRWRLVGLAFAAAGTDAVRPVHRGFSMGAAASVLDGGSFSLISTKRVNRAIGWFKYEMVQFFCCVYLLRIRYRTR